VTERLIDLLKRSSDTGRRLNVDEHFFLAQTLKEKYSYIARDIEEDRYIADTTNALVCEHVLPDGTTITLNRERFLCSEIYFEPKYFAGDSDLMGVSGAIEDAIANSAMDLRSSYYRSIILAGGASLTKGFANRLKWELRIHNPAIDLVADRQFLAFRGGSIVAELNDVNGPNGHWWIKREEYAEEGGLRVMARFQ
jgi:hypothetical protein